MGVGLQNRFLILESSLVNSIDHSSIHLKEYHGNTIELLQDKSAGTMPKQSKFH